MMREFTFVVPILLCWTAPLSAQTPAKPDAAAGQCSLTLVNALPGPGNLHIKFGAEEIWPPGFTPGQSTGAVFFPSGKKMVDLVSEGFARTQTEILMPAGGNFAMIFFPGEEINDGPDKGKRKIGVFSPPPILPNQAPQGKNWKVILVGSLPQATVRINQKSVNLERGQPVDLGSARGEITVAHGEDLLLVTSPEENGNYWITVIADKPGSLAAVCLNHIHYNIP